MNFRIADTFTASLAKFTGDEQKAAKTTAFDLQMNPASPGMSSISQPGSKHAILIDIVEEHHLTAVDREKLDYGGRPLRL